MDDPRWAHVSGSGVRRVYRLLCLVAYCDHELHPAERVLLEAYRRRFGIPPEEAEALEDEGRAGVGVRIGRDPLEQRLLLDAMIDVAAADGRLERKEQKRLVKIAGLIGLGQPELLALVKARFAQDRVGSLLRDGGTASSIGGFFVPPIAPGLAPTRDPPSDPYGRPPNQPKTAAGIPIHVVVPPLPRPPIPATDAAFAARSVQPTQHGFEAPRGLERLGAHRGDDVGPGGTPRRPGAPRADAEGVTWAGGLGAHRGDEGLDPFARPGRIPELRPAPDEDPGPPFRLPANASPMAVMVDDYPDVPPTFDPDVVPPTFDPDSGMVPPTNDPDRARRAAEATPIPDRPLALPAPIPPALGKQHESSLSLSPGVIVLLGVLAPEVRIDLTRVPVRAEFRGFAGVPPGLHHVTTMTPDGAIAPVWVNLVGGGVVVKVFDQKQRRFVEPAPLTLERYGTITQARGLGPALSAYPYDSAVDWVELTVHLDPDRFPPGLKTGDPEGWPSRLEAVWRGTHGGDGQALLTEVAWAFLAGVLERHPAAYERWLVLFKACLDSDPQPLAEDPALFVLLADLLAAQLHQMPDAFFDRSVALGVEDLSETYELTRIPHLAEAGERLRKAIRKS